MKYLGLILLIVNCQLVMANTPCGTMLSNSTKKVEFEANLFSHQTGFKVHAILRRLAQKRIELQNGDSIHFDSELPEWPRTKVFGAFTKENDPLLIGRYTEFSDYYIVYNRTANKKESFRIRDTFSMDKVGYHTSFIVRKHPAGHIGSYEKRDKEEVELKSKKPIAIEEGLKALFNYDKDDQIEIQEGYRIKAERNSLKVYYTPQNSSPYTVGFFAIGKVSYTLPNGRLKSLGFGGELELDWMHVNTNPSLQKGLELLLQEVKETSGLNITYKSKVQIADEQKAHKNTLEHAQ